MMPAPRPASAAACPLPPCPPPRWRWLLGADGVAGGPQQRCRHDEDVAAAAAPSRHRCRGRCAGSRRRRRARGDPRDSHAVDGARRRCRSNRRHLRWLQLRRRGPFLGLGLPRLWRINEDAAIACRLHSGRTGGVGEAENHLMAAGAIATADRRRSGNDGGTTRDQRLRRCSRRSCGGAGAAAVTGGDRCHRRPACGRWGRRCGRPHSCGTAWLFLFLC
mmetsp:Transcript_17820/g.53419  ORF Transcript_17820/g.53419 Transcript_17820/m.53419 type:complete len:219 (+) Transcript_17820:444-1100(+)